MLKSAPALVAAALFAALPAAAQDAAHPAATPAPEAAPAGAAPAAEAAAPAAEPAAPAAPAVAPAPAASGTPSAQTVVATVNGEAITLGQMIAMKQGMHQGSTGNLPALWDLMLDQIIQQAAVAQVAAQSLTERDKAMLELDRRTYLANAALERVAAAEPTEEELRAAYDVAFGAATAPKTEYNAAHILVATEEEAKAIADELAKGADFGKLAEERSTDNSGANKGDLGWFTADMMVKPFADAVTGLEKGKVSAPVQSQFGWHVIKLNDSRTQAAPEFDAIRDQLAMQVRRQKVDAEIQKQVAAAKIEKTNGLDAALLNKTDLLDK